MLSQITISEIDFMARYNLQEMEKEGLYPPHFRVKIDGTHTIEKATAHLTFPGTANDLVFDIHLIPPTKVSHCMMHDIPKGQVMSIV